MFMQSKEPQWLKEKQLEAEREIAAIRAEFANEPPDEIRPEVVPLIRKFVERAAEKAPTFQTYEEFKAWFGKESERFFEELPPVDEKPEGPQ
jgi:hypothetical protein